MGDMSGDIFIKLIFFSGKVKLSTDVCEFDELNTRGGNGGGVKTGVGGNGRKQCEGDSDGKEHDDKST